VIGALVAAGKKAGLNDHDMAAVIAIVRFSDTRSQINSTQKSLGLFSLSPCGRGLG
jgi:hypothetical protein